MIPRATRIDRACFSCGGGEISTTTPWRNHPFQLHRRFRDEHAGLYVCSGCINQAGEVLSGIPASLRNAVLGQQRRGRCQCWRPMVGSHHRRRSAAETRRRAAMGAQGAE